MNARIALSAGNYIFLNIWDAPSTILLLHTIKEPNNHCSNTPAIIPRQNIVHCTNLTHYRAIMVNHYALLGVPDNATQQQIWQAYQDIHLENGGNGRKRDNRLVKSYSGKIIFVV